MKKLVVAREKIFIANEAQMLPQTCTRNCLRLEIRFVIQQARKVSHVQYKGVLIGLTG